MRKLLIILALLSTSALAQQGNTISLTGSGAPTGSCSFIFRYIDSATGNEYNCFSGAWHLVSSGGGGSPSAKTTDYIVVAGDSGKTIPFNCSSACTATLTSAATVGNTFAVRIMSYGSGAVTISSSSTINGLSLVLKNGQVDVSSDGTAFYSSGSKAYTFMSSVGTTDALVNPGSGAAFATTLTLPPNLPIGTKVHIQYAGDYTQSSATTTVGLAVRDGSAVEYCSSENITAYNANGNSGNGTWQFDCWFVVKATGASGSFWGDSVTHWWTADNATINGIVIGNGVPPGYDNTGTRMSNDSRSGTTFDDTVAKTLSVKTDKASTNITIHLVTFNIDIILP